MIGVTLLAAACGYVSWQAKIVRERRALLMKVRIAHGEWWTREDVKSPSEKSGIGVSLIRRMLGDHEYGLIMVPKRFRRDDEDRIREAFPEAGFYRDMASDFPDNIIEK